MPQQECSCPAYECVIQCPVKRPAVRLISNMFAENNDGASDPDLTHIFPLFGQFLNHDISMTQATVSCSCCQNGHANDENCMPIEIPLAQQITKGVPCLAFTRSRVFCENYNPGQREQMNAITGDFYHDLFFINNK